MGVNLPTCDPGSQDRLLTPFLLDPFSSPNKSSGVRELAPALRGPEAVPRFESGGKPPHSKDDALDPLVTFHAPFAKVDLAHPAQKRGQEPILGGFLGRPRGFKVDWSPRRAAVRACHSGVPNG